MGQFNLFSFGYIDEQVIIFGIAQPSQYFHFGDDSRRIGLVVHGDIRIETTYSVDWTEINQSVLVLRYAAAWETACRDIVRMTVIVEAVFIRDVATDSFIITEPDITFLIFRYGTNIGIE